MPVLIVKELWNEFKPMMLPSDRSDAAEILVSTLLDHDIDPKDIYREFKTDSDIKPILDEYLSDPQDDGYQENFEDEDTDEDDDYDSY